MTTKLKIDIASKQIEVEGSESFVERIYQDFKALLEDTRPTALETSETVTASSKPTPSPVKKTKIASKVSVASKTKAKTKKEPEFLKNLDLSGGRNQPSLEVFLGQFEPKSNYERNLIFIYYLTENIGIKPITLDHLLTCYRDAGLKIPLALEQSVRDTSNTHGWLDIDDLEDIKLTIAGRNYFGLKLTKATTK